MDEEKGGDGILNAHGVAVGNFCGTVVGVGSDFRKHFPNSVIGSVQS